MSILGDQGGGSTALRGDPAQVREALVVFKTHLDLGFTDFAHAVRRRFLDDYIPRAMAVAREVRARGGSFTWTTGSWLIEEALEDAQAERRRELEAAISAGDLAWHALPFTTHTELMDPGLVRAGLAIAQRLDARFGRRTIAAKMTDVPGHTRGLVPLLAEAGVAFLHIGVNPYSTPPAVPPLFRWRSPCGAEVVVQYDAEDYGITTVPPGADVALAFAHTGDNAGPQSADEVQAVLARTAGTFPAARVRAATLDDYARGLAGIRDRLPVVTGELGDTWIHGAGTAPRKVAGYRTLLRLRRGWDAVPAAFDRQLLCVAEHTWGMSRARLDDYRHWRNDDLAELRRQPRCIQVEASWREQEAYVDAAVAALAGTPHQAEAQAALRRLDPVALGEGRSATVLEDDHLRLELDPATGAAIALRDLASGRAWCGPGRMLGLFGYQQFSQATCERFLRQYGRIDPRTAHWGPVSFARPDFDPEGRIADRLWRPDVRSISRIGDQLVVRAAMAEEPVREAGCPAEIELRWRLAGGGRLELDLLWRRRRACRLPDAMWCSFQPVAMDQGGWRLHKLGQWISPHEVVAGGNRRLHAVQDGVRYREGARGLHLDTLDAPLVAPGRPLLYDFSGDQPEMNHGVHVNLWNNWWNTNFPYWSDHDGLARFRLTLT